MAQDAVIVRTCGAAVLRPYTEVERRTRLSRHGGRYKSNDGARTVVGSGSGLGELLDGAAEEAEEMVEQEE
jgi:hypothetical protein